MQTSKLLTTIGLVVVIIGGGLLLGWWGSREKGRAPISDLQPNSIPATAGAVESNALRMRSTTAVQVPILTPLTNAASAQPGGTNLQAHWEEKLDEILGSEQDDTNKVKQLFEMFPHLPEEGQTQAAEHLENLVPDDNYSPLGQLLQNSKLSESVLDVLMSDLLNRPNAVKLPMLLQLAQSLDNPKADESKDLMELYLDEEDPAKWPQKMQEWLKENPD